MPIKVDIGDPKSKRTFHLETSSDSIFGKKIGDMIEGTSISEFPDLRDYEFIITGLSDIGGLPALAEVEGSGKKRLLLTRGKVMRSKKPRGLRLRKLVRGNTIAQDISQLNLKVSKQGEKDLMKIFGKEEMK